jgi:hypothetical protein
MSSSGNSKMEVKGKPSSGKLTLQEKVTFIWFLLDVITHLTIELGYVWVALGETAEKSDTYMGEVWRLYGRADARWAVRDPTVISLEIVTVFLGFLCVFQLYGIVKRSPWRHVVQVIICVAELYGGWVTFAPEWVEGSPNLDTSDPVLLWIYLVFMNGLWVVMPIILMWDSVARIVNACATSAYPVDSGFPSGAPSLSWFYFAIALLVSYSVLVPAVLLSADPVPVKL